MSANSVYCSKTITDRNGREFLVEHHYDADHGAPWEEWDGCGIVSDWTTRSKRPGEVILSQDCNRFRYYDFASTIRKARQEGWGLSTDASTMLLERLCRPRTQQRPIGPKSVKLRFGGLLIETRQAYETVITHGRDPSKPLTAGEILTEAVWRDYRLLKGWCNDEWHYMGVVAVPIHTSGDQLRNLSHSCWGLESNSEEAVKAVELELLEEAGAVLH